MAMKSKVRALTDGTGEAHVTSHSDRQVRIEILVPGVLREERVMARSLVLPSALGILLTACGLGSSGAAGNSPHATTPGAVAPGTATPSSPHSGMPTAGTSLGDGKLGDPGAATTAGRVTVVPGSALFERGRPVLAVVANGTAESIYVEDLHTGCSIGVLQRQENGWVALPDCGAERKAAVLAIGPGHGRTLAIDPASLDALGSPLVRGTYRLAVGWRTAPHPEGVDEQVSFSAPFQVR